MLHFLKLHFLDSFYPWKNIVKKALMTRCMFTYLANDQ